MAVNAFVALEPFPGWSIPWQDGRTILITGATSGIGLHASRHLAQAGARLILGCRDMKAAEDVVSGIRSESGNANIEAWELDLSKFDSVRAFAERIEQNGVDLDVVVHNAGISPPQGIRQVTTDGHELVVQTNHLSPFLLTHLLLPSLKRAAKKQGHARIVYVTGLIANAKIELDNLDSQNDWVGSRKYADTKLMNIVVAMELGKRLKSSPDMQGVIAHVLAPGFFRTGLARDAAPEVKAWLEKLRDEQAADIATSGHTETFVACHPSCGPDHAWPRYIGSDQKDWELPKEAHDMELREGLWKLTSEIVGLEGKAML